MNPNKAKVNILGEEFIIKGAVSSSYLARIAEIVDTRMRNIAEANPKLGRQKVAVLACLNLADELVRTREESKGKGNYIKGNRKTEE